MPVNKVFPFTGANKTLPDLSNTAYCEFTQVTMWRGPTAKVMSGGAPVKEKPKRPVPVASKLVPRTAAKGLGGAVCTNGSGGGVTGPKTGSGISTNFSSSFSKI